MRARIGGRLLGGRFVGRGGVEATGLVEATRQGNFSTVWLRTIGASVSLISSLLVLPVLLRNFGHKLEVESKVIRLPAA